MKQQSLRTVLTTGAIALGVTAYFNQPSQAQSRNFFCSTSHGVPATIASTPRGNVTIIRWVSSYFNSAGYSPQKRCEEVSARFQRNFDRGTLNWITVGLVNDQPVVCVSQTKGGSCLQNDGVLFTLKSQENASSVVKQLFNISAGDREHLDETPERIYIEVSQLLNSALVDEDGSSNTAPNTTAESISKPNLQPTTSSNDAAHPITKSGLQPRVGKLSRYHRQY